MTVRKLFFTLLLVCSLVGLANRSTRAQSFDVDVDNRIMTIRTDNTDDIIEIFVDDDDLIVKVTQFSPGSLSTSNFLEWASQQGEGYISELAWDLGLRSEDRSRDLDDVDVIQILSYGGTDKILVNRSSTKLVGLAAGAGDDEIVVLGSSDGSYLNMLEHHLHGQWGNDYIKSAWKANLYGDQDDDELHGSDDDDVLRGGSGNDELFGHDGRDDLFGESGMDYLNGGNDGEIDYLSGGADTDELVRRYYKLEKVKHEYKYYEATWVLVDGKYVKKWVLRTRYIIREQRVYTETEIISSSSEDILTELPDNH